MGYMMQDWRGNKYRHVPMGVPCDERGCKDEAVRLACTAEGHRGRTHWHGGIHTTDGARGMMFCLGHGRAHGGA